MTFPRNGVTCNYLKTKVENILAPNLHCFSARSDEERQKTWLDVIPDDPGETSASSGLELAAIVTISG